VAAIGSRSAANLALLALVAGLAALAWWLEGRGPAAPERRLSTIVPRAVKVIELRSRALGEVLLERTDRGWRMRRPYPLAASGERVERLLALLNAPSLGGFRAAGNDLAEYGLDPPRATLRVDGERFELGATEPLDGRRYVLHDGEVHLTADVWVRYLELPAAALVDPAPLGPAARVRALALPGLRLREGPSGWRAEPAGRLASADRAVALVAAWEHAQAFAVRPLDPALEWHEEVAVEVAGEPRPLRFRVARGERELILARPDLGLQYHLTRDEGERLLGPGAAAPGGR